MVGDSTWDCEAAERAGIASIGVLTGGFSEQELREAGAACVFERLDDLRGRAGRDPAVSRLSQQRGREARSRGRSGSLLNMSAVSARPRPLRRGLEPSQQQTAPADPQRRQTLPRRRPDDAGVSRAQEDRRLLDPLPPPRRPGRARGARRAPAPAGAPDGAALPPLRRAARRSRPGRDARADQGDRPLRPGARDRVLLLRGADDARRAQALLPRQRLGRARPARDAGARDAGRQRGQGPVAPQGPLAVGRARSPTRST